LSYTVTHRGDWYLLTSKV